jgi:hypothetical protein
MNYLAPVYNFLSGVNQLPYDNKKIILNVNKKIHVRWVRVTTAWRVLRLRMEETPSSFGGKLRIY